MHKIGLEIVLLNCFDAVKRECSHSHGKEDMFNGLFGVLVPLLIVF